jgi:hypothetical protein
MQHPPAQLLERRIRQLHLRLDTISMCLLEVRRRVGGVAQQRGFADARLTSHNQRPAAADPNVREQPVKGRDLLSAAL